jgi:hypothetical protein
VLHVTNGQSAANVLRAAGFPGDVLCWNDVLHEGPVPDVAVEDLRRARARFLSDAEWTTYETVLRELTERDARLAKTAAGEEIVLWFEHDLYDQLQLIQVIDQLAEQRADWRRVTLICGAEYLGLSTPDRLRERLPHRVAVNEGIADVARRAWKAFRSSDPTALLSLLETGAARTEGTPFLDAALRRHLEQFPSTRNGLSRSEDQALAAIAAGAATVRDAFIESQRHEDPFFLGDTVFADYLQELSRGPAPLVVLQDDADPMDAPVRLTDAGAAVLRGADDRVRLNGIDRWYGGVHLEGRAVPWRWDGKTVVSARS